MKKIKIILVEDDKEIRELAEAILCSEKDMEVIKTFSNGENFLKSWENFLQIPMVWNFSHHWIIVILIILTLLS